MFFRVIACMIFIHGCGLGRFHENITYHNVYERNGKCEKCDRDVTREGCTLTRRPYISTYTNTDKHTRARIHHSLAHTPLERKYNTNNRVSTSAHAYMSRPTPHNIGLHTARTHARISYARPTQTRICFCAPMATIVSVHFSAV